ncbi:MAG: SDR family NAD(P)-dependent oxidoreductase, partial [Caldilineae bacterium]
MDLMLQNRTAAVAAASKGLGKAAALELAKEGARVAICSRNRENLEAAAAEIKAETGRADCVLPVVADVTTLAGCQDFIDAAVQHFGGLDILVTNAGGPPAGPAESFDDEQWRRAIDLNLLSTIR